MEQGIVVRRVRYSDTRWRYAGRMKAGAPFRCTHCNAQLSWRDEPVIECEYCHTKILMKDLNSRTQMGQQRPVVAAAGKKGLNPAVLVVAAAVVGGIVLIATRAGSKKKKASAPAASQPEKAIEPAKPVKPAEPAKPPSIATEVLTFGEKGSGAGQFTNPRALTVTPSGEIVVAEVSSGRVQVFDATGTYQKLVTVPPNTLTKELNVYGAGATPDGKVVISRPPDLLVLDIKEGKVDKTIKGNYPDVYYHGDVDVAQDGSIWATTDRTGDLGAMHLSAAGKVLGSVKKIGTENIAVDGLGTIYLLHEYGEPSVEIRDGKGEVKAKFSQAGTEKMPRADAIAVDGKGHIFVATSNHVLVFDPQGAFLGKFDIDGQNDIAVDMSGAIYVLSSSNVRKFTLNLPAK